MRNVFSFLLILTLVFAASRALVRALPGNPIETILAETGTSIPEAKIRAELGLDRPFVPALIHDASDMLSGDWGRSILTGAPVGPEIWQRLKRTLTLAVLCVALSLVIAIPLGVTAAASAELPLQRAADRICTTYGAIAAALPTPWLAPILAYGLAVELPILPLGNSPLLPAVTLAIPFAGFWARLIRERVRETLQEGSAPSARARGLAEHRVLLKYGLAPASGSLLAFLGTQVGALLAGAAVTETILDWPGLGSLLVESVQRRDYPLIEASVFVAASASLLGNRLGDWLQAWWDPR